MTDKLLSEIITFVQKELSQIAGVTVQIYSEDLIAQKVQTSFELLYSDRSWKRFQTFETYTLDGTTGRVTGNVSTTFKQFEDIYKIYPVGYDQPLSVYSMERNPAALTGTFPLEYTADRTANKIFRVLPITATGQIAVVGRIGYSTPFAADEVVPFDYLALGFMTAWQYAVDDASNSAMIDKFKALFDTRIAQLKKNQEREAIALNPGYRGIIPNTWQEW